MHWTGTCLICSRLLNADKPTRSLVLLQLLLLLLMSGTSRCQQTPPTDNGQVVLIRSNSTTPIEKTDYIQITFFLNNEKISLSLQRNPNILSNVSVVLGRNGSLVNYIANSSQKFAYYIDPSTDASVLVKTETNGDGTVSYSYTGVFQVNGETYSIEPDTKSRRRRRRRSQEQGLMKRSLRRRDAGSAEPHVVQKEDTSFGNASSPVKPPNVLNQPPPMYERIDGSPGDGSNTVLNSPPKPTYVVEVLAVVDYRIYQQIYDLSTESTDDAKAKDTINQITQLYGHVINGVDMRYRSINVSTMAINVRFAGCYIAQDSKSSPFIENNRVPSGSYVYVPAVRALSDFSDWINENKPSLPPHNQASLYALDPLNGATGDRISGLAYYKAACSYWAVLICRHASLYAISEVTAHEIGHNLGAVHDGVDNACSAALQNIMVASSAPLTDATYKNAYTFSSCSVSEITGYILTLPPVNCLTVQSGSGLSPESLTPLGALISPDAQCALIYGNGSFYCSGLNEDKQICRMMGCFHPSWEYCVTLYDQQAFPGTQCGDKMWCYMGDCVSNDKATELAPATSADCLYGDSKVPFFDGFQCDNVWSQPSKCYEQSIANSCCRSCRDMMDETFIGCEYGDRYAGCAVYQVTDCKDSNIKNACCKTCADLDSDNKPKNTLTTPTSTTLRTTSTTTPTTTPTTTSTSTTTKPTTSTTTTPSTTTATTPTTTMRSTTTQDLQCIDVYGSWCHYSSNFPPSYCYSNAQYYCCAFCASIRDDSQPGCEYGDHFTWCDATRCANPSECQSCCGSCKSVLSLITNATSPTTTTTTTSTTTPTTTTSTSTTTSKTNTPTTTSTTTSTTTPTTTSTTTTPTTTSTTTSTTTPTTTSTKTSTTTPTTTSTTTSTTTPTTTSTTTPTTTSTTTSTTTPTTTTTSTIFTTTTTTPSDTTMATGRTTKTSVPGTVCVDSKSICASIDKSQCYSAATRNLCCQTCRNFGTGAPGCEYDDQFPTLCATISSNNCPYYKVECCLTCNGTCSS